MNKLIFLFLSLMSCSVFAGGWQPSWSTVTELLYEGTSEGEKAYVTFSNSTNPDECTDGSSFVHQRIYGDSKKGEYIISTLLAALAAGKQVRPLLSGCDDMNRPIVVGLRVK